MLFELFSESVVEIVRLHLKARQADIRGHNVKVVHRAFDDNIVERKGLNLYSRGRLRLNQNVRKGGLVNIRVNPTACQITLRITINHQSLIPAKSATC